MYIYIYIYIYIYVYIYDIHKYIYIYIYISAGPSNEGASGCGICLASCILYYFLPAVLEVILHSDMLCCFLHLSCILLSVVICSTVVSEPQDHKVSLNFRPTLTSWTFSTIGNHRKIDVFSFGLPKTTKMTARAPKTIANS